MKRIALAFTALIFATLKTYSQDYHYSQFDANPTYLNPALLGERLSSDYTGLRLNVNYRDQKANYSAGPGNYRSVSEGLDIPVGDKWSVGQYFSNDRSVNNVFTTTNFMFGTSYKLIGKNVDGIDKQNLAVGVQFGMLNKSYSPVDYSFDSQYSAASASGFDLSLPNGENFNTSVFTQFNTNVGLYYRVNVKPNKMKVYAGTSLYNITTNRERINGVNLAMPLHFNAHFGMSYQLDDKVLLAPQVLYMAQNKAQELNVGSLLYYSLNKHNDAIIGFNWRNKNAFIVQLGVRVKGITLRTSYCFVNSYLMEYKNRGLEFSLVYTSPKKTYRSNF